MPTPPTTVICALDAFKGSINAAEACAAVSAGWRTERPGDHVRLFPMADGGEGTLDAFASVVPGASHQQIIVTGPDNVPHSTTWLLLPASEGAPHGTAVVELARTSGIELLGFPPRLRPLDAHTLGFGEAISAALEHGVSRLILGIGSSSSTDGGVGMLTALGARFTDSKGQQIPLGGRGLFDLAEVDMSDVHPPPPGGCIVISDVVNPLTGPRGAAVTFGPQKGANHDEVTRLDDGLSRLARMLSSDKNASGAGAAGGVGFGLLAWGATLTLGAVEVAQLIGLPDAMDSASLVITGEGSFDGQSEGGKAPWCVANLAANASLPAALVAGMIAQGAPSASFASCVSLTELAGSSELAMRDPARWLRAAGESLARAFAQGN